MNQIRPILALVLIATTFVGCGSAKKDPFRIRPGMSKQQVEDVAGEPDSTPRCWLYQATKLGTGIEGLRICFAHGVVSLIQTSQHA